MRKLRHGEFTNSPRPRWLHKVAERGQAGCSLTSLWVTDLYVGNPPSVPDSTTKYRYLKPGLLAYTGNSFLENKPERSLTEGAANRWGMEVLPRCAERARTASRWWRASAGRPSCSWMSHRLDARCSNLGLTVTEAFKQLKNNVREHRKL